MYFALTTAESGVRWALDEDGEEVPNTRVVGGRYLMTEGLPDPTQFTLGALPPIISDPGDAEP